jgi:hypothetical protein
MIRIVAAIVVACTIALISTESSARARIRMFSPSKAMAATPPVQPKPSHAGTPARAGVFVGVGVRPSSGQRSTTGSGYAAHGSGIAPEDGAGPMQFTPDDPAAPVAEKKQAEPVVPVPAIIISRAEPKVETVRASSHASAAVYCYRKAGGGCAPF